MSNENSRSRHLTIAAPLRGEVVDDTVLLLDAQSQVVIQLEGDQARVARHALDDTAVPDELVSAADGLRAAGLLVDRDLKGGNDGAVLRRRFLAGAVAATGIAVFHLPSAAAAASGSDGSGNPGGEGGDHAPAAPNIVEATPGYGSATITIVQPDNGGGAITNYEYSLDDGSNWIPFSPAVTTGPLTITGLTGPTTIRLRAVNATGASTPSGSVSVAPLAPPAAPVVTGATATSLTAATLSFTQPGSVSVSSYDASTDGGTSWFPVATTSGSATITGLGSGGAVLLRAVGATGNSPASNATTATPGSETYTANGTFTVPAGVTVVDLEVYGGAGGRGAATGANAGGDGGQPAKVTGTFTAVAASTRAIIAGQGGNSPLTFGAGDANGGYGGAHSGFGSPGGGSGGGGGGATSVKGSGLNVHAGGGGGGGGAATTSGTGGNARNDYSGLAPGTGGRGDDSASGGGGGGGGGGGVHLSDSNGLGESWGGSPGISGFNANTAGTGGWRGGSQTNGLTGGAIAAASGRTIATSGRSQGGEATFRWLALIVS